jgi:hypothetical protein
LLMVAAFSVVIFVRSPLAALSPVTTFITPVADTSK